MSALLLAGRRPASALAAACLLAATAAPLPAAAQNLLSGQNIGIVGGALAGGVAGNKLVGKKNKTLGTVGGAVGGAVLGGVVGNMVDSRNAAPQQQPRPQQARMRDPQTTGSIGGGNSLLNGQNIGMVGGALAGGVAGNQLAGKKNKALGTVGGALGGGLLGGAVGNMLDRR